MRTVEASESSIARRAASRIARSLVVAVAVLAGLVGCGGGAAPEASAGSARPSSDDHDHSHSHSHSHSHDHSHGHGHHHHHHEAERRPRDFPDAVAAVRRRHALVLEELEEGHLEHAVHELEKLLDVVDRLPSIAADSDMPKAPWDEVHAASKRLRALCASGLESLRAGRTIAREPFEAEGRAAIAVLEPLVGTEKGEVRP
jgi:hypothetical protein